MKEVEHEMDVGIGERAREIREAALGKRLVQQLAAEKAALVEEAGARSRATLEYERDGLRTMLAQALRIQIEVSRKEREALEGSLAAGYQVDVVRDLKYSYAVSDEHLYWPYEGEFWRDELGTYSYTLTKGCKDRLPAVAAEAEARAALGGALSEGERVASTREPSHGRVPVRAVAAVLGLALVAGTARGEPTRKPKEADLGAKKSVAPDASLGGSLEAKKKEGAGAAGPALELRDLPARGGGRASPASAARRSPASRS